MFTGSPKSEKFLSSHLHAIRVPVALSLGATLDYYTGRKNRAPRWIRNIGFEWLFRFLKEPFRLGRRYIAGNVYFIYLTFRQYLIRGS